jgi:S-adenosylmethionine/arginine decarboxylase-like enzyme
MIAHKQLIGRFEIKNPPTKSGGIYLDIWFRRLIEAQGMTLMAGPLLAYNGRPGLEGWSGTAIIETSHVALHIWDKTDPPIAQLDFYTCGHLDVQKILAAVEEWDISKADWWVLDREFVITKLPEFSCPLTRELPWA